MKEYTKKAIGIYDKLGSGYLASIDNATPDEIEALVRAAGFNVIYSKIRSDDAGRDEVKRIRMIAEKIEK